jgi:allantoin racemase
MDILVVNCNTSAPMTSAIGAAAEQVAGPGTRVRAVNPSWGVASAEGFYDSFISAAAVLDLLTTWTGPCDGVVMAGYGEHGREGARQLLEVPVVDVTEASVLMARPLGERFGVVTTTKPSVGQIRQSIEATGLWSTCAGIAATGLAVLDLDIDVKRTVDIVVASSRELMETGADVVVLGCAGMSAIREPVEQRLGAPVVDCVAAGMAMCEGLIRQSLRTSKVGGYSPPDFAKSRPGWPTNLPNARLEGVGQRYAEHTTDGYHDDAR